MLLKDAFEKSDFNREQGRGKWLGGERVAGSREAEWNAEQVQMDLSKYREKGRFCSHFRCIFFRQFKAQNTVQVLWNKDESLEDALSQKVSTTYQLRTAVAGVSKNRLK